MTLTEIFWICALKGVTVYVLKKVGLFPSHEALEPEAKAAASAKPTAYAGITLDAVPDRDGKVWSVKK